MKANRTKMMARNVVKLVNAKWCVLRICFKLYSKMVFVLCNLNTATDRLFLFACSPVHAVLFMQDYLQPEENGTKRRLPVQEC